MREDQFARRKYGDHTDIVVEGNDENDSLGDYPEDVFFYTCILVVLSVYVSMLSWLELFVRRSCHLLCLLPLAMGWLVRSALLFARINAVRYAKISIYSLRLYLPY
jgi:hypothetical protein